ncbi:MAG: hypothetical protein PHZ26_02380 [Candidatus Gracilibacteria bacterium]|nr:hypothetical protein [Candidatus Gracilibacteria bacterium]MDD2908582.1 hypothetical protein [Candidatus Gracilibacteria bacterium]
MAEKLQEYRPYINNIDVKGDGIPDSKNENKIKDLARNFVENEIRHGINEKDLSKLLEKIKSLLERQDIERINLGETLKEEIKTETREKIDKESLVNEAKNMIYENLGINDDLNKNNPVENFLKGIIDELVVGNYELAIEIINTNGKIILSALEHLASWEGIKNIAKSLGKNVWDLLAGNAYEKGKSVAQLGLITTGVGATVAIGKKGFKMGMKQIVKFRGKSEIIAGSPKIKSVIYKTVSKVDELVPKKQLNFESFLVEDIAKLGNKERLEAGSFYLKKKLTPKQEKAVIEAHEVGNDRHGAGMNNYTPEELKQKAKILKKVGFNQNERKVLMEKGVCAKVSDDKIFQLEIKGENLNEQVDYLFKLAEGTRKDYDKLLTEIGSDSKPIKVLNSKDIPLKNRDKVIDKIKSDYEGKHPEMIRDILRGSIVYDDIYDLKKGLQLFKDSDKISIIHIKNRLNDINANDILLNIRFPNGFVGEVQLHIKETLRAKEFGFKLDKNIIDLTKMWTKEEGLLLEEIKEGKKGIRLLDKEINLPSNIENISGHGIYEITRSLGDSLIEKKLRDKLNDLQRELNLYARDLYKQRTGKKFN